ncbi:DUF5671 domain-containing protein [uncultured Serinicoccus sp.]|uniref:DUF5671 domain-containing protein n=1 Tax=uncultured Serinicoccus sp. TaxID=735514 RepID=UPI002603072E|nr:DUF5671 domain-containing protein [uncultured Serinicoccus sp.]
MIIAAVSLLVVVGLVVALVSGLLALARRRADPGSGHGASPEITGTAVRRFFQYLLLTGMLVAAASGLTGLLGRLLERGDTLERDDQQLALQLTFVLIALPVWAVLAWWTTRRLRTDDREARSVGWSLAVLAGGLIALVVAVVGWIQTLSALVGPERLDGFTVAQALVWTVVYVGYRWWAERPSRARSVRALDLLGSLIGLGVAVTGLARLTGTSLRGLTSTESSLVSTRLDDILVAGAVALVGGVVWVWHWLMRSMPGPRDTPWLALVLLAGVGGGLVMAIVGASLVGYDVLVWWLGDPAATSASQHFRPLPFQVGVSVVGLLVWWYHQAVLDLGDADRGSGPRRRSEVRRVYEYLLAAIGLLAAAAGLVMVIVTLVEALAGDADLLTTGSAVNTLLATIVLLAVGLPVWWRHWRQAQRARGADPEGELASPTRRSYLLVLFGVAAVTAVGSLLTLVYLVLEDALGGRLGTETLRAVRYALGVLVTASLLTAYHWSIFRDDREHSPASRPAVPRDHSTVGARAAFFEDGRQLLLVVPSRPEVRPPGPHPWAEQLRRRTGAHVRVLEREDLREDESGAPSMTVEDLLTHLEPVAGRSVVLLVGPDGLQVIPVGDDREAPAPAGGGEETRAPGHSSPTRPAPEPGAAPGRPRTRD